MAAHREQDVGSIVIPELVAPPDSYLDPCPCGSGKPYIDCCWWRRLLWESPPIEHYMTDEARSAAQRAAVWQIGWVPFPNAGPRLHDTIFVSFLIVASGEVIWAPTQSEYPASLRDRADESAIEIARAAHHLGSKPAVVWTRHAEFAEALRAYLEPWEIAVAHSPALEDLDGVARAFLADWIRRTDGRPFSLGARMWSAWQQPDGWLPAFFETLAGLYRLAVWDDLGEETSLLISEEGRLDWYLDALREPLPSLRIFTDPSDALRMLIAEDPRVPGLRGQAYALAFQHKDRMQAVAVHEVEDLALPLAADEAFPWLFVFNTPGCMLAPEDGERLLETFQALNRVWPEFRNWHSEGGDVEFDDELSGMRFSLLF